MPPIKLPFQDSLDESIRGLTTTDRLIGSAGAPLSGKHHAAINAYERLLRNYGVEGTLGGSGKDFICHCPFNSCPRDYADKEPKLQMSATTGQWQCFRCHASGNNYGFIRQVHKLWLSKTTDEHYKQLCSMRHNCIDIPICQEYQLAWNANTQEWMFPTWAKNDRDQGIVNLYRYTRSGKRDDGSDIWSWMSNTDMKHYLLGIHQLRPGSNRPIWVFEGHWDFLCGATLLYRTGKAREIDILGMPGAGVFPVANVDEFNGRVIAFFMDNDEAGRAGLDTVLTKFSRHSVIPNKIEAITWPSDFKSGFDVNDAMHLLPQKYVKV